MISKNERKIRAQLIRKHPAYNICHLCRKTKNIRGYVLHKVQIAIIYAVECTFNTLELDLVTSIGKPNTGAECHDVMPFTIHAKKVTYNFLRTLTAG